MAHHVERRPSETMDMEYVYMDLDCLDEQDTMMDSRRNYYEHEYSSHPPEPCANVSNTLHAQQEQQQQQQQYRCTSYNNTPRSRSPRSKTPPPRTDSGESQRSLPRRGAAGHAEMQRSAFLSSQNEQLPCRLKIKAEVESSQDTDTDTQPHHKRPRRFTKDPKDEEPGA